MRKYTNDMSESTLSYHEDVEGGVICQCPFCKHEIKVTDSLESCPVCYKDLVFPLWCDW